MKAAPAQGGVLIVGAGIAGLYTALKLAPRPVTIVTAGRLGEGGSSEWAQGGLAAAVGEGDTPEQHLADTIAAGAGLVDEAAARILCEDGPARIHDLLSLGVPFDTDEAGNLKVGREAAHGRDRIVHVGGDEAGATIMRVLTERARAASHIEVRERHVAERLIVKDGRVAGAVCWDIEAGEPVSVPSCETILATGGAGGLFAVTTNPLHAQGHGLVLAYEAGASLRDLEFVQFHPTGIDIGRDPAPLATEALRGDGATLHDAHGRRFMRGLHEDAELAPRDVVARGVAGAIKETGAAFLDARAAIGAAFPARFPTVFEACMAGGVDPRVKPIPVAPAAHYHMGGVLTDLDGRADVPGLWAVGEVASTGVHGANRLASNSLLEALVFGARAARAMPETVRCGAPADPPGFTRPSKPATDMAELRRAMSRDCGLLREAGSLGALLAGIDPEAAQTVGGRLARGAAKLIVEAALSREESRGAHQRTDFPEVAPPRHSLARRGGTMGDGAV
ncbi:L-aspartate oxidase [Parvularcula dongshanensis]|uniref:L-aspartate oxidase n=1 Tax=Parvularcula dongshanensis TaxID=1173995 RepID=A0A840I3Y1_9PROT|nr:L-aspartate oxidase [Parvularcula dongshanensis]MBB4658973.1 L-aspartate oxidase [Parvularcula dongshanensis]